MNHKGTTMSSKKTKGANLGGCPIKEQVLLNKLNSLRYEQAKITHEELIALTADMPHLYEKRRLASTSLDTSHYLTPTAAKQLQDLIVWWESFVSDKTDLRAYLKDCIENRTGVAQSADTESYSPKVIFMNKSPERTST